MSLKIGNTLDANHYWAKGFENQFQQLPRNGWYVFKKTQVEINSRIEQYERLYKKHVILESELAKAKAKGKAIGVLKIDLDKMRNEINLLEKQLDKENTKEKHSEEKNELLEHHN